jgi:hypothetical protein
MPPTYKRRRPLPKEVMAGYGQKVRLVVLCRFCKERGWITAADEVDHIDGDSSNNERDDLRPLCGPCQVKRRPERSFLVSRDGSCRRPLSD